MVLELDKCRRYGILCRTYGTKFCQNDKIYKFATGPTTRDQEF